MNITTRFQALQNRNRPPVSMVYEDYFGFYDLWAEQERADAGQWDKVLATKWARLAHQQTQELN